MKVFKIFCSVKNLVVSCGRVEHFCVGCCSEFGMMNMCNSSMEQSVLWRPGQSVSEWLWSCQLELQLVKFIRQSFPGVTVDCLIHLTMPAHAEDTRSGLASLQC